MQTFYNLESIPELTQDSVVTFGVFDGLHIGHQDVLETVRARADADELVSILFGFYPHPLTFLAPEKCPPVLMCLPKRIEILEQIGIDIAIFVNFNEQIASMPPNTFVNNVLLELCRAQHVIVGYACQFGKDREGNAAFLESMGEEAQFGVTVVPPTQLNGLPVHSTRIRQAIARGDLCLASQLLGRIYSLSGTIIRGDGRGRQLGFPTANIEPGEQLCPPNGVYAIRAKLTDRWLDGVVNIGIRPTFNGTKFQVESHFFEFDEVIYGKSVEIFFVEKIRSERKFSNMRALVQQIQRDITVAEEILSQQPNA
ncbi:MAG: bifunctional riboflavin kinase/FAD synthetase [Candidatus Poribacteria bacterium]|nr:bifunctional riboflavin kinase/FAD synthetase [Candidatus Poribacteria bacterium]